MNFKKIFRTLSSLKLTIACLLGVMVLVILGTLEQVSTGVEFFQETYIRSFFLYWSPEGSDLKIPYFPGGYIFSILLIINLLAAFVFRPKQYKVGIFLLHLGIATLIFGELINGMIATESQIVISEGDEINYSEDLKNLELIIKSDDETIAIPETFLKPGREIKSPTFTLSTQIKYPNARLLKEESQERALATRGAGKGLRVEPIAKVKKDDQVNFVAAIVEVLENENSLGTWLVSNAIDHPQTVTVGEKEYTLSLRPKRHYFPFRLKLVNFTHEKYPGTNVPKNFASEFEIYSKDGSLEREAKIYMNHPLRYGGKTFYQASYGKKQYSVSDLCR